MKYKSACWGRVALLALVLSSVAHPVAAQDSARASLLAARGHMESGQEHYAAARYEDAAREFMAAYEARPFSAFLYNAAVALERFGTPGPAADLFQRYLDAEPGASDAEEVRAKIAALRAQATAAAAAPDVTLNPDVAVNPDGTAVNPDATVNPDGTGTPTVHVAPPTTPPEDIKSLLSIQTEPEGAVVSVFQGTTLVATSPSPFDHSLDEGNYRVTIEHPDYRTVEQNVHIGQGRVYVVIVEMSQGQFLGYLRVVTDPPDADVFVDNLEEGAVGRSPYANVITTGTHTVWVSRPGYERIEQQVEIGLGEDVAVRLELERVTYGRVRILGNIAGAAVHVDGQRVGEIPYEGDIEGGEHRITVSSDGMKDWSQTVTIVQGQIIPIQVRLRPAMNRGGAWATATMGVLMIGGGIALGMMSNGLETDLRAARNAGTLNEDDPRLLRGRIYRIGADSAFGIGALLGLLSIYYFLRDPLPDSEANVFEPRDWTVVPHFNFADRSGGAQLQVSF
ncbi:MAG: PEGA domain-containing protein [Sandaracinaceae bacterium]|jgi:hypothetical protein|nr:PEGA domain-containing protein [Sandaracinaceae bacterium]MBP7682791.1 PEGA domain-containing protein [Deltaproteobacteria bacterium]MBK6813211.1 PEGA domain-containing protein [Sandaracinaceae bacterium]MBK7778269.1 PEGA domain-containing protein [Sandaracinaceae bacterium]MBK8412232.1 PEGA domain-containing protein [Sandaracinaceae bacterium]